MKKKNCNNCIHPDESLCWNVEGNNFGYATIINDNFTCKNWKLKGDNKDE